MTTTAIYKNIGQIAAEIEHARYLRPFDYARAIALTNFMRELEAKHGEAFRIVTAHPIMAHNRDNPDAAPVFSFGLWARWAIDKTEYYLQMDSNPFFPAYITRTWRIDAKTERSEYAESMNDVLYRDADWNATPKTIAQLTENMHAVLADKRRRETYKREIPAYDLKKQQTIYKR